MSERPIIKIAGTFSVGTPRVGPGELYLTLPIKRSVVGSLFILGFLLAFCMPYLSVGDFLRGPDDSLFGLVSTLFILFWFMGWTLAVIVIATLFLGSLVGRETIHSSPGVLTIKKEIFGCGFAVDYDTSRILELRRVDPEKGSSGAWRGPHLAFDFDGQQVAFGSNLGLRDSEVLITELNALFSSRRAGQVPSGSTSQAPSSTTVPARSGEGAAPKHRGETRSKAAGSAPTLGSPSTVALILANSIPIFGVLLLGWRVGEVMLLFWAESAVVGVFNLCKMWVAGRWSTLFFGPFFVGHYGGFMSVHLLFIYAIFLKGMNDTTQMQLSAVMADFVELAPALVALFISHGISFFVNFIKRAEHEGRDIKTLMMEPYRRIFVMHLTLIAGGFLAMMFENSIAALLLMITLKIFSDARAHLAEHKA